MNQMEELERFIESFFGKQINDVEELGASQPSFDGLPDGLDQRIVSALRSLGIEQLYKHQVAAYRSILAGKNTVLVSQTASGKTLSFLLPILQQYLTGGGQFTSLLLYPTKALARDQESTLGKLLSLAMGSRPLGTFDGDTPRPERELILKQSAFVLSNPDMLHAGVIPHHHRRWRQFLSRLKYIVIDEVHSYRGAHGSHVANVLRRLLRVCKHHGANPRFVCCSATIGNPREHVEALCGGPFEIIDQDGSARPERRLYFINPEMVENEQGVRFRRAPASCAIPLIRKATELQVRTICFVRGRQEVERLRQSAIRDVPRLEGLVQPYRGGLLPSERRTLERDLAEGQINTVITTNALELGIDIGKLQLCILCGHPGSMASFWQQAGRVGRAGQKAIIVFIARNSSVDQYLVHHRNYVIGAPIEQAWLSPNNPYILLQHLPCAAHEYPLADTEPVFAGDEPVVYRDALQVLLDAGTIKPYGTMYRYALEDYPSRGVNIRGMSDHNIQIVCGGAVIGELDPIGARGTLYKDAIYQHLGRRYMSEDLDLERKTCTVCETDVNYYTEAVWESRVAHTDVFDTREFLGGCYTLGGVHVNKQPKMYKKIRERTYENIGYGPITLAPFVYDTVGYSFIPGPDWATALRDMDDRLPGAGLYGLSYVLRQVAPSVFMGDVRDIDTDVSLSQRRGEKWHGALYVFDAHEGGVGYAEKVHQELNTVYRFARQVLEDCRCAAGCPACVPPLPPGVVDEELEAFLMESNAAKAATLSLLIFALDQRLEMPRLKANPLRAVQVKQLKEMDRDQLVRRQRLKRAAHLLAERRDRTH